MWLFTAVVEVGLRGDGGKVHDGIGPVHQPGQHVRIAGEVGDDHVVTRSHDIDAAHVVAGGNEPVHQTPSDTPRRPGDHNTHVVMLARALQPSILR